MQQKQGEILASSYEFMMEWPNYYVSIQLGNEKEDSELDTRCSRHDDIAFILALMNKDMLLGFLSDILCQQPVWHVEIL